MSDSIVDISRYMQTYIKMKNKAIINEDTLCDVFKKLFSKKYNTVCMDIDKTVTNGEYIDDDMLEEEKIFQKKS